MARTNGFVRQVMSSTSIFFSCQIWICPNFSLRNLLAQAASNIYALVYMYYLFCTMSVISLKHSTAIVQLNSSGLRQFSNFEIIYILKFDHDLKFWKILTLLQIQIVEHFAKPRPQANTINQESRQLNHRWKNEKLRMKTTNSGCWPIMLLSVVVYLFSLTNQITQRKSLSVFFL